MSVLLSVPINLLNKAVVRDAKLIICKMECARTKTAYTAMVSLVIFKCICIWKPLVSIMQIHKR